MVMEFISTYTQVVFHRLGDVFHQVRHKNSVKLQILLALCYMNQHFTLCMADTGYPTPIWIYFYVLHAKSVARYPEIYMCLLRCRKIKNVLYKYFFLSSQ